MSFLVTTGTEKRDLSSDVFLLGKNDAFNPPDPPIRCPTPQNASISEMPRENPNPPANEATGEPHREFSIWLWSSQRHRRCRRARSRNSRKSDWRRRHFNNAQMATTIRRSVD